MSDYEVRPACVSDIGAYVYMQALAGPGFTSLSVSAGVIAQRLQASEEAFAKTTRKPDGESYFLSLVHTPTNTVVGLAQVKAAIEAEPFFCVDINDTLALRTCFEGFAEVGSLFVAPEHRRAGVGRMLAQARYRLIASHADRFGLHVISRLRGVIRENGYSPFWDAFGGRFLNVSFLEADAIAGRIGNRFLTGYIPHTPIPFPESIWLRRHAIGKCHPDGLGAQKLLIEEGFQFTGIVDPIDGGPVMIAHRGKIKTVQEKRAYNSDGLVKL